MKYALIVLLFSISINTNAQTASGSIEQTFIFQLTDEEGKPLNLKTIHKKQIKVETKGVKNLTYSGLSVNGDFVVIQEGTRYYGDYNEVQASTIELIYVYDGKKMSVKIKNIQAAYFKITTIPFKSGNYVIDLQHESDFIKKLIIKPTNWKKEKVVFEEVKKEKKW